MGVRRNSGKRKPLPLLSCRNLEELEGPPPRDSILEQRATKSSIAQFLIPDSRGVDRAEALEWDWRQEMMLPSVRRVTPQKVSKFILCSVFVFDPYIISLSNRIHLAGIYYLIGDCMD